MSKPKLALYWAASCGGCEVAVLDVEEKILDIAAHFDLVFWPCAMDFKYKDVAERPDGDIDLCLFNGAIRTTENETMARLLRSKSKVLVAFGSCAAEGCIPGLANLTTNEEIFRWVYESSPSTIGGGWPQRQVSVPEGELEIPEFLPEVRTLRQTVFVDYVIPGCPPQAHQIVAVLSLIMEKKPLPPVGAVLGAGEKTCCDECGRQRAEKRIKHFHRPWEVEAKSEECLLDQGIVCLGPATRSGCGALCVKAQMPCRGCYGPPPNVSDQGARMISALASVIDSQDPAEIQWILDQIPDPAGLFYRFSVPSSTLHSWRMEGKEQHAEDHH